MLSPLAQAVDGSKIQADELFPKVQLETSAGLILLELNRHRAPITVNNFLRYTAEGHYDNTIFHRIVPDFVVQGGGYTPDFTEKPTRPGIFNESGNGLSNDEMTIAMARYNDPHSASSQFYFNITDNESLNPGKRWGYTVFGEVLEGWETIISMAKVETDYSEDLDAENVPVKSIILIKATIVPVE